MKNIFQEKTILVTGGAGSIGSEIVVQLLKHNPKQVRVFDNRETELFHMQHRLAGLPGSSALRFLLGDVRDRERLRMAMENVDIVFHAAAYKHVPLCEYNPFEAVKTNVHGTQDVIEAALYEKVEKVINISTDKVTNTINTLGATKLLAERLIVASQYYKGSRKTTFCSVRFGNVVGSRGSVIDLFDRQMKSSDTVTLTNPDMTRFIMTIGSAINLVFKAAEIMQGGEIFIFKMPASRLSDLCDITIERLAPKYGKSPKSIRIKNIGLRPGEKMHENLMTEEESKNALETDEMFIVLPELIIEDMKDIKREYKGVKKAGRKTYYSNEDKPLTKDQLRDFLVKEKIL